MRLFLAAVLVVAAASASAGAISAADPVITQRFTSTFASVQPPGRYVDLAITVSEFDPGARTVLHTNPATRYFTVIAGELSITIGNETKLYTAGMNGVSPWGILTRFSNERGTAKAQLFLTSLWSPQPAGPLPPPSVAPGETAPSLNSRVIASGRLQQIQVPTTGVNVVQVVQDWDAGAKNSPHTMNHPHLFISLEGENTTRYTDGAVQRTGPGQQGVMDPGRPGIMENTGTTNNRLLVAWVVTPGTPNTSPAPSSAITPPRTGSGGLHDGHEAAGGGLGWLPIAAALGLVLLVAAIGRAGRDSVPDMFTRLVGPNRETRHRTRA